LHASNVLISVFIPDYAGGIVTRVEKPQRNANLQGFCAKGIVINMLRSKIVKSCQGLTGKFFWPQQVVTT